MSSCVDWWLVLALVRIRTRYTLRWYSSDMCDSVRGRWRSRAEGNRRCTDAERLASWSWPVSSGTDFSLHHQSSTTQVLRDWQQADSMTSWALCSETAKSGHLMPRVGCVAKRMQPKEPQGKTLARGQRWSCSTDGDDIRSTGLSNHMLTDIVLFQRGGEFYPSF